MGVLVEYEALCCCVGGGDIISQTQSNYDRPRAPNGRLLQKWYDGFGPVPRYTIKVERKGQIRDWPK